MKHIGILVIIAGLLVGCSTTRTPLPTSSSGPATAEIRIAADQSIYVNGQSVEPSAVASALNASGLPKDTPVLIRTDKTLQHRDVIEVLEQVNEAGFVNVSFATQ